MAERSSLVTAIVLAGGEATRFPENSSSMPATFR